MNAVASSRHPENDETEVDRCERQQSLKEQSDTQLSLWEVAVAEGTVGH